MILLPFKTLLNFPKLFYWWRINWASFSPISMLRQATTQRFGVRVSYFEYQPIFSLILFSLRAGDKLGYPNPRRRVFTTARNRNGKCSSISCHYSSVPIENHNQSIGTLCKVPRKRVELIKLARLDKPIGSM